MSAQELLAPFLGALQASISVLITISFGVIAAQFGLLSQNAAKELSRTCVRMFLPALLIYKVGSEISGGTAMRYVPIIMWSLLYNAVSAALGAVATRMFKLPPWVTVAITFNNTTSLPLLLIKSLDATGILDSILVGGDTSSEAIDRATSYFLINSTISNCLTFALGPRLLRPHDEDAPDKKEDDVKAAQEHPGSNGYPILQREDEEAIPPPSGQTNGNEANEDDLIDEESSLLPRQLVRRGNRVNRKGSEKAARVWDRLPDWTHTPLEIMYSFMNAPLMGAIIGAIIGISPALHRLFFNESTDGGFFNAWLTTSIKNIGDLFTVSQIIVVGVKLSLSLRRMKKGENSGRVPWQCVTFITVVRFFMWPLISIPLIWLVATKTSFLNNDPILWFAMMLMPTGPPAMILAALGEMNDSPEEEKMAISKLLTIEYFVTPLTCFAVVGALKASEAGLK
ncbi:hypothetical protein GQ43DRAFT_400171 [Delitschia confertaspora ATCC 74209]|uniref:Uncharacterized protein n=1 Tax=Delitschia confertaspora ATCC 74209 TaxID=1513339 RepID=A0A9P4JLQ8_9PLEO|nr:hypothetical protein GQ43DRAFT_400171 [Delitschia confertaspora ATCC 74209]